MCALFQCSGKLHVWVTVGCLCLVAKCGARAMRDREGGGEVKQVAFFLDLYANIPWITIYYAKPRPNTRYPVSLSRLGR